MSAYVDEAAIVYKGKARHHLTADSVAELHAFAAAVGIARCWFHRASRHPHYDITCPQREAALAAGAHAVDSRQLMRLAKRLKPTVSA